MANQTEWKLDRHIPIAFLLMVLVQTGGAFWWASRVDSSIENNSEKISVMQRQLESNKAIMERVVRLEVIQENSVKMLYRIDEKLSVPNRKQNRD